MTSTDQYTCFVCKQTFTKVYSDEEAMAEARSNFGPVKPEECEFVCDDCHKRFMQWLDKVRHNN